ncbi:hypothetical protein SDC9_211289 [bioreactor metagenome]|uniref:Uncharacterized protein n=1 Tax=bioreactor metagenome TaxID=1076179 RepID=A0A645JIM3_9ZZZZ
MRAAWHERGPPKGAYFSARNAAAKEVEALVVELLAAPVSVLKKGIAAIDENITGLQIRFEVFNGAVYRGARRDH